MDLTELLEIGEKERQDQRGIRIRVCVAAGCLSANAQAVKQSLEAAVSEAGLADSVQVAGVGCLGLCSGGPLVAVDPENILYEKVTPADAPSIVAALKSGRPATAHQADFNHPFFTKQVPIVLENSGKIDPERIEDYIAANGYQPLCHALREMKSADVVDTVIKSGLRGRGAPATPRVSSGPWSPRSRASGSSSSAMPTRATRAPSWTGASWKAIRIACWRAWRSPPTPWAPTTASSTCGASTRSPSADCRRPSARRGSSVSWEARSSSRLSISASTCGSARGAFVCGEETALMASIEGEARRTASAAPHPGGARAVGLPDPHQQCGDVRQHPRHHSERRGLVRQDRDREEQGDQGLRPGRQDQKHRPHRGAHGHAAPRPSSRRWAAASRRRHGESGTNRRPVGGCIPPSTRHAGGLRVAGQPRLHHGVRRDDRDGSAEQHGGCGPVLHGVLHGRVLRESASPAAPGRPRFTISEQGPRGPRPRRRTWTRWTRSAPWSSRPALCGLGQSAPNPVLSTLRYFRPEYEAFLAKPEVSS